MGNSSENNSLIPAPQGSHERLLENLGDTASQDTNTVSAFPTKRFFVSMLTRDIELGDAIMDLLDNCVDGILRVLKREPQVEDTEQPYTGYWARIVANPEGFSISDNCGGIPKDVAIKSAFRLGRVESDQDRDIATVGMYGIGMKRALFKIGKQSSVKSYHSRDSYTVEITPDWLESDLWTLPLIDGPNELGEEGTAISVSQLYEPIATQFNSEQSSFLLDLKSEICNFYSLILQKGFRIYFNEEELQAVRLDILIPTDFSKDSVPPYAYRGIFNDVTIELFVGFYRRLATEAEVDNEQSIPRSTDNAGWTIICNDRVVLHHDKTPITGWGSGNVPKYHPQFIAIAGVVRFYSDRPLNLPLNTTKRGLDTSSEVYWHTRRFMQEGLKKFTDFTYHWKGQEEDTNPRFALSAPKRVTDVVRSIPESAWTSVRGSVGERFVPNLPRPTPRETKRRVSFMRLAEEIALLGDYYFQDRSTPAAQVGNESFEEALERARRGEQ